MRPPEVNFCSGPTPFAYFAFPKEGNLMFEVTTSASMPWEKARDLVYRADVRYSLNLYVKQARYGKHSFLICRGALGNLP